MKRKQRKTYDNDARNNLKQQLCEELDNRCALSGKRTNLLDMHEWLVKRSDYPFPEKQDKIFHKYNCIILSREQHGRHDQMQRDYECAVWAIKKYGYKEISEWLQSLQLRTFRTLDQWIAMYEDRLQIPTEKSIEHDWAV